MPGLTLICLIFLNWLLKEFYVWDNVELTNCTRKIWATVSNCIPMLCRLITSDVYELLAGAM